jgi:branched-chain amino acid transport system substrate-binding protein
MQKVDVRRRTSVRRFAIGAMVIGSVALSGCGSSNSRSSASAAGTPGSSSSGASAPTIPPGPIKIGAALALTGSVSFVDVPQLAGIKLAIKDINAKGGVLGHKLTLVYADTKSNLSQVANTATTVLSEGAEFMIPTLDYDFGGPSARVAGAHKIIAVSTAGDPRFGYQGIGPYMFNVYPASPTEGSAAAQFMAETKGWKDAYVLTDTSFNHPKSVCAAFTHQFTRLGGTVAGSDTFQNADQSIATQITRMRSSLGKVKAIMLCSLPPGGLSALRQIRAAGINVPIVLDAAFDGTFWLGAVPNESNTYVMSTGSVDPTQNTDPEQLKVLQEFKAMTGTNSNFGVGLFTGYSAVQAIAKGIAEANSINSDAVAAKLEQFQNVPLAIGPVTWSAKCHVSLGSPLSVLQIVNGKQKYITRLTPSYVDKSVC